MSERGPPGTPPKTTATIELSYRHVVASSGGKKFQQKCYAMEPATAGVTWQLVTNVLGLV